MFKMFVSNAFLKGTLNFFKCWFQSSTVYVVGYIFVTTAKKRGLLHYWQVLQKNNKNRTKKLLNFFKQTNGKPEKRLY